MNKIFQKLTIFVFTESWSREGPLQKAYFLIISHFENDYVSASSKRLFTHCGASIVTTLLFNGLAAKLDFSKSLFMRKIPGGGTPGNSC